MRRHTVEIAAARRRVPFPGRSDVVELDGIGLRMADHYTRLMPVSESTNRGFRLAMLPVRAVALIVLWGTSTPMRLVITAAAITVIALGLRGAGT
jgi:hypothetical protein